MICSAPMAQVASTRVAARVPSVRSVLRPPLHHRRVGQVLVAQGVLTVVQLRELLDEQATADQAWTRLGDLAVARGLDSPEQLTTALLVTGSSEELAELEGELQAA